MARKTDTRGASRAAQRFRSEAERLAKAKSLGLTGLMRRIRPEAVRDIQTTHNLTATRVRESLAVRRVGDAVELGGLDRETGLIQYGAKWSKRNGVSVLIRKDAAVQQFRRAFIRAGLNNNRHVFQRKGAPRLMTAGSYMGKVRQPIVAIYGPSVAGILRSDGRRERLTNFAMNNLTAEIRRQIGRL